MRSPRLIAGQLAPASGGQRGHGAHQAWLSPLSIGLQRFFSPLSHTLLSPNTHCWPSSVTTITLNMVLSVQHVPHSVRHKRKRTKLCLKTAEVPHTSGLLWKAGENSLLPILPVAVRSSMQFWFTSQCAFTPHLSALEVLLCARRLVRELAPSPLPLMRCSHSASTFSSGKKKKISSIAAELVD